MANFAYVQNGRVERVHVLVNDVITDEYGVEQEAIGQAFLADLHGGDPADFIQCSYSGSFRGVYPGPGYTWDGTVFAEPVPSE